MEGLELSTPALSGRCSDQLSYITILSGAAVAYPGPTHLHRGFIQQSSLSLLAGVVSHLSSMASTIWWGCTEADTLIGERSRLVVLSRARPGIRLPPGKRPLLLHWSFPPFAALTSVQWLTALDCPPVFVFPDTFRVFERHSFAVSLLNRRAHIPARRQAQLYI